MTNLMFYIFCLLLGQGPEVETHEFHLSKGTINYNTSEKSVQITLNMFIDDLELALSNYGGDSLKICTKKEDEEAEDYIYGYILNRLEISVGDKVLTPSFIGKEQSEDLVAVWCYLEIEDVDDFREIKVKNSIMTDLFDDQKNLTSIQKDRERIADILFTPDRTEDIIEVY